LIVRPSETKKRIWEEIETFEKDFQANLQKKRSKLKVLACCSFLGKEDLGRNRDIVRRKLLKRISKQMQVRKKRTDEQGAQARGEEHNQQSSRTKNTDFWISRS
jgi:hypothetical protein